MTSPFKQAFVTEMTRKQFLLGVGAAALALTGISKVIAALTSFGTKTPANHHPSAYGGRQQSTHASSSGSTDA